ncbi:hypothetical protein BDZ45DRAFT_254851 [Acephala macrosclerotiorum]|nr:hypothetical protein BDZ45DRAFT_254851 [Acephala macrosclerotiorum]
MHPRSIYTNDWITFLLLVDGSGKWWTSLSISLCLHALAMAGNSRLAAELKWDCELSLAAWVDLPNRGQDVSMNSSITVCAYQTSKLAPTSSQMRAASPPKMRRGLICTSQSPAARYLTRRPTQIGEVASSITRTRQTPRPRCLFLCPASLQLAWQCSLLLGIKTFLMAERTLGTRGLVQAVACRYIKSHSALSDKTLPSANDMARNSCTRDSLVDQKESKLDIKDNTCNYRSNGPMWQQ